MRAPNRSLSFASGNRAAYRKAFLGHVHKLLRASYDALTPAELSTAEEDDITGELCKHMKYLTETAPTSPWMRRYSIHDQDPVNDATREGDGKARRGKRRPRLDIRIVNKARIPNASFSIEAKRLHHSRSVSDYMDHEGLNAFVQGYYAKDDDTCGMLGYVQTGSMRDWIEKLHARLANDPSLIKDEKQRPWSVLISERAGMSIYLSRHNRQVGSTQVDIHHTFLLFL